MKKLRTSFNKKTLTEIKFSPVFLNDVKKIISFIALFAIFFCFRNTSFAQTATRKTRILFLLDASSSMTYGWNEGYTRFEVASNILLKIMDSVYSINNEIEFAVRAYGTMYPAQLQNCIDTKLEVPFNLQNTNQIKTRLKNLKPLGSSPIAFSLKQASENELNDANKYDYSVIFITDGGESCKGDVCKVYLELLQKKISVKPYIIGLDRNETLKSYYECLGNYIDVKTPEDIGKAVSLIVDANKTIIDKPKQLKLVTTFSNIPTIKDTVKKIVAIPKDTLVEKIVVPAIDTPIVRNKATMASMKVRKVKVIEKYPPTFRKLQFVFPNAKEVTLRFDTKEPTKEAVYFAALTPSFIKLKPNAKPSIKVKKANIALAKKVSLQFEYEAPKKLSPNVAELTHYYTNIKLLASKPKISVKKNNITLAKKATLQFEYELPKRDTVLGMKLVKYPRRYSYAYKMPKPDKMVVSKKAIPLRFEIEAKKVVAKKDTVAAPIDLNDFPVNSIPFNTEVVASTETMVQVYFKGNNGKTYPSAKPMILMQDARTNQTKTSFTREMKGNEPIPQKVSEGVYNLVIKGFDDLYAKNITIKPNTTTKVFVDVNDGTLKFTYQGNIKRPISEYKAIVNRRFAAGATVVQKCDEVKTYDPGTYYVEVNTLPTYKASIDLTFDAIYEIQIPEPGVLAIMNSTPLGKVQIQSMLGDQFVTFYTMEVTGKLNLQKLQLQPINYKLIYPADPKMPQAGNKELNIKINSNIQTELELK